MTLHHFTHQAIDGAWHAVYRSPGCDTLNSIGDAISRTGAQAMADAANREQARRRPAATQEPGHHRIPRGFYTDADAA
jgi:hypothetical protein